MATFGLTHTLNTPVGNDFIRGVSGGERKRVSIAEAALGQSPVQCWDNSTRGLDSATALEFVRSLRLSTDLGGSTAIVAIYQASQSIYDVSLPPVNKMKPVLMIFRSLIRSPCFMKEGRFTSVTRTPQRRFLSIWVLTAQADRPRLIS
jgi:hypothetical protein